MSPGGVRGAGYTRKNWRDAHNVASTQRPPRASDSECQLRHAYDGGSLIVCSTGTWRPRPRPEARGPAGPQRGSRHCRLM